MHLLFWFVPPFNESINLFLFHNSFFIILLNSKLIAFCHFSRCYLPQIALSFFPTTNSPSRSYLPQIAIFNSWLIVILESVQVYFSIKSACHFLLSSIFTNEILSYYLDFDMLIIVFTNSNGLSALSKSPCPSHEISRVINALPIFVSINLYTFPAWSNTLCLQALR
jgi:hypothetical protein